MAEPDFALKRGDTVPALEATLTDQDGPINLTTATSVKLLAKSRTDATTISGTCSIVSAAQGKISYTWVSGNTSAPGSYDMEFEITWGVGQIETVPNDTYLWLEIAQDLG